MINFEVKKGDYIDCKGFSKAQKEAVFYKFEALGFNIPQSREWLGKSYIAVDVAGQILSTDNLLTPLAYPGREITLEQLMFCDQPDDVTHCYYDGENITYNSGDPYAGQLICTREAKDSRSWYEKGEFPPVGEVVEYIGQDNPVKTMILGHHPDKSVPVCWHQAMSGSFEDLRNYSVDGASYFRPIKSERDKAIISACDIVDKNRAKSNVNIDCSYAQRCAIEALVDAGWRPTND